MLMTTRNQAVDLVTRTVGALFEAAKDTYGATLEYTRYGFQDMFPDSPDETLQAWWAPAPAALTVEGETYFSNQRYRDLTLGIGLFKSLLNNGKALTDMLRVTRGKLRQIKKDCLIAAATTKRRDYATCIEAIVCSA